MPADWHGAKLVRRYGAPGRRVLVLGIFCTVLGGCALQQTRVDLPSMSSWEERQSVLASLDEWTFRGRIAVKAGDEGFNGKLQWAQDGSVFSATVGGPLGIGTVKIDGDGRAVTLTDKDNVKTVLVDVEADLYFRYGWTIPVSRLRYWALGIPDPSIPATTEFDSVGHLVRLKQSDWTVEITEYREGGGAEMPRKLTASNANTRVRLVIGRWQFFDR